MKKILVAQAVVILVLLASCGMGTQSEVADSEGSSLNVCENGWVQSIVPENGATEIGLSSDIIITAKEGVDISFIDDASIIVSDVNGDISGEAIKDPETNTIKF